MYINLQRMQVEGKRDGIIKECCFGRKARRREREGGERKRREAGSCTVKGHMYALGGEPGNKATFSGVPMVIIHTPVCCLKSFGLFSHSK